MELPPPCNEWRGEIGETSGVSTFNVGGVAFVFHLVSFDDHMRIQKMLDVRADVSRRAAIQECREALNRTLPPC